MVTVELAARLAERGLEVDLHVRSGETLALLGPNGSGKSTILGLLAGLVRPDTGRAVLGDAVLFEIDEQRSVWRPAHERGIGLLAQDPLLFPHLTARENVAFGPRSRGERRSVAHRLADQMLESVGTSALADRRPGQLSGGQAQRVALARALATDPALLLLDEPMAALDVGSVPQMRSLLRDLLPDRTVILVTHDILDALLLADRIVVLTDGRIVEEGTTSEVVTRPRSVFAAQIAGLNMLHGSFDGAVVTGSGGQRLAGLVEGGTEPGACVVVFSPAAVAVHRSPLQDASPRNVFAATVTDLEPRGSQVMVRTDTFAAEITAAAVADLGLAPGDRVHLSVKASEVRVYPDRPRRVAGDALPYDTSPVRAD